LGRAIDPRHNSLNALRLVFAVMVIFSHAWPIGGLGGDPAISNFSIGGLGVSGFFAISGYLITDSRARKSLGPYLAARALRILPGLWVALLAVAFVAAPLAAISRGGWSVKEAARYVIDNAAIYHAQGALGSTLDGQPIRDWNGSLWTLFYEVLCYLAIGAAFLLAAFAAKPTMYLVAAFLGATALGAANRAHYFDGHVALQQGSSLVAFFFAGALIWAFRDRLSAHPLLAAASAAAALALILAGVGGPYAALPIAYLVLWLGQALPEWTRRINSPNDISYGVYIYAFPVTQLLVLAGVAKAGGVLLGIAATAVTVPLAVASWFLIERPAKRLRRRASRRQVQSIAS
jgi:peptidoglycan/LPS O-acetylase OafA/YrhL